MKASEICLGKCCGCSACMSVCAKDAICMVENERGFRYPAIDETKCVDCGLCRTVCKQQTAKKEINKTVLIKIKDNTQHLICQSGGVFTAASDAVLQKEGTVFGVVADENFEGVFGIARNKEEREAMHGSKYMQARTGLVYRQVEEALKNGKVLFSGTPCQVAALYKYLSVKRVSTDNLYTVDLICHGVPSVLIWRGFMNYYKERLGEITHAMWRSKIQTGWGGRYSNFYGKGKKETTNYFCRMFFTDLCLRDSCYSCNYTSIDRMGDLSIGDAWGVSEKNPEFNDSRGVSLMLINSAKGMELFKDFESLVDYLVVPIDDYAQKHMREPSKPHRNVEEFWEDYKTRDFSFMIKKYSENNLILNYKYAIKKGFSVICRKK